MTRENFIASDANDLYCNFLFVMLQRAKIYLLPLTLH